MICCSRFPSPCSLWSATPLGLGPGENLGQTLAQALKPHSPQGAVSSNSPSPAGGAASIALERIPILRAYLAPELEDIVPEGAAVTRQELQAHLETRGSWAGATTLLLKSAGGDEWVDRAWCARGRMANTSFLCFVSCIDRFS